MNKHEPSMIALCAANANAQLASDLRGVIDQITNGAANPAFGAVFGPKLRAICSSAFFQNYTSANLLMERLIPDATGVLLQNDGHATIFYGMDSGPTAYIKDKPVRAWLLAILTEYLRRIEAQGA